MLKAFLSRFLKKAPTSEPNTRFCMIPFSNPCHEPNGNIRLCSASSTFGYNKETQMGNVTSQGLLSVWTGEKYRSIRKQLLTGKDLTPYCSSCEYRVKIPAWAMRFHMALYAHEHSIRDREVVGLIASLAPRYDEYKTIIQARNTAPLPLPEVSAPPSSTVPASLVRGEDLPIGLDLNTLNRCNVTCIMCPPALHRAAGEPLKDYYRLTAEEFQNLTDGVRISMAHFIGAYAEPLLNKDIFALVAKAKQSGSMTAITTNAQPLVPAFADKLLDAGLDVMTISLHGATKSTAEAIMLGSRFERIIENIKTLQRKKAERQMSNPILRINFVSQTANVQEIPDIVQLAAELGVQTVFIIHLIDGPAAVDSATNLLKYPELAAPKLVEAKRRGKDLGVNVVISPAYLDIMRDYEARHAVA